MTDDTHAPWDKRPPHLQHWIDERSGVERVYFRKGSHREAMKSPWGTKALAEEAAAALLRVRAKPAAPAIGTLVGAVHAYAGKSVLGIKPSADFIQLSISTQMRYERWISHFEEIFVGVLLEDVDAAYILALRDAWAPLGYEAANTGLQVLKNVCKPHIITGAIVGNPFEMIDKVQRPQGLGIRNPRWEDSEVDAVIAHTLKSQPGMARAVALGRWGGFRRQTICSVPLRARIKRPNRDGVEERRIYWLTEKKEVLCDRREDLRLTELLDQTPSRTLTIAYNSDGHPWKARALNQALDRVIARLAKKDLVRPTLTIHGLRHARGVEIALMGGSDAEIMAGLDHASSRTAAEYRKQADRLRLADAMQDRVDAEVIRLRRRQADGGS